MHLAQELQSQEWKSQNKKYIGSSMVEVLLFTSRWPTRAVLMLSCALLLLKDSDGSSQTMKEITSGFLKVLNECKHELNLSDSIVSDFFHFWKQDYALLNRDTGCAIICISNKLHLVDSSGRLHHENAHHFAQRHGAESDMAMKLVEIIHRCEGEHSSGEDECVRVLEVAKCFRNSIHDLNWAPTVEDIIEEVLTEIV